MRWVWVRLIWSSGLSNEWIEKGRQVAEVLPHVAFVTHSGGCWPHVRITQFELGCSIVL
ncbi:hypothetical protein Hanom_Chr07g00653291 [Helianthus anomalus]